MTRFRIGGAGLLLVLIWALSLPAKLSAAHNMVWDIDLVPVVARGLEFYAGGPFPAYGTLSSVAAFNMPMLIWLHLPVLALVRDPFWAMLLTLLAFNALATWAVYRLGRALFSVPVGLAAALLFTFGETGISSSYTAWAQLLLPGFFALLLLSLWRWRQGWSWGLAWAGILATAAFMTHFSAVLLYPLLLGFALLARPRWALRPLIVGALVCGLLLAPYLIFQAGRDFADLRAFITRDTLVDADVMARYQPGARPAAPHADAPAPSADAPPTNPANAPDAAQESRLERGLRFLLRVPGWLLQGAELPLLASAPGLAGSPLSLLADALFLLWRVLFWGAGLAALIAVLRGWRAGQRLPGLLVDQASGRALLLLSFCLGMTALLIVLRATPDTQPTYYAGLLTPGLLLLAWGLVAGLERLLGQGRARWALLALLMTAALLHSIDRVQRVAQHDDDVYSRYNVWLYRHVDAAARFIAADWAGEGGPRVAYDFFPEADNFWWVQAWHSVDPLYGIGMSYDALLLYRYGVPNAAPSASGDIEDWDYRVTYTRSLERQGWAGEAAARFGAIVILRRDQG